MFSDFIDKQAYEPILMSISSIEFPFLKNDNSDLISELKEDKILENVNEGDFNNEFKKKDSEKNQYSDENTGFSSKIPSTQLIKENQNIANKINKIENFSENLRNDKIIFTKNIIQINDTHKPKKEQKLLGRKCKNSKESGEHDKFSDDNLSRRCKHILLNYLFIFINNLIKNVYYNNLSEENKKQLLKINYKQVLNTKVDYNIKFLNKKLKDIFSDNISTKYRKYSPQYNKLLIEEILNEKDEVKKNLFEKLFNLTFLECLKYFRGEIDIDELKGMIRLEQACENLKNEKDYENYTPIFKQFILNFETNIISKKTRKRKKKKKVIEN